MKPRKKKRKILKILLVLSALAVAGVIAVNLAVVLGTSGSIVSAEKLDVPDADCILVLGAGVREDGTPSQMLTDRLLVGIALYEQAAAPKLLMSGDHGSADYDEVNTMKRFAVGAGVAADDIFMDHAGFSTYESMIRARNVFGVRRVIIVTQEYHLYRALWLAKQLGLEAVGVPADLRTYLGQSARDAREIAARVKDFFAGYIQPAPTYPGEYIGITGSGSVTDDRKYD